MPIDRNRKPTFAKKGFVLPVPALQRFDSQEGLIDACRVQAETVELLDANWMEDVDIDGRVNGSDYRLSPAAFGDLCHIGKMPVSFVKGLAEENESLALDVMHHCINARFQARDRLLLVDTVNNRIDGIVGKNTYSAVTNKNLIEWLQTVSPGAKIAHGWLEGPNLRVVTVDAHAPCEIQLNDVVHVGVDASNSMSGEGSVTLTAYNERLVCSNGMRRREDGYEASIRHTGDAAYKVQQAVVQVAASSLDILPLLRKSAVTYLTAEMLRSIRHFVAEPSHGGSPTLDKSMTKLAQSNAVNAGRKAEELTVWDMVNGVTEAAHDVSSLKRRVEIEAFAHVVLRRYASV